MGRRGDTVGDVISDIGKIHGIPIPKGIFSRIFKEEKPENAFVYILNLIKDAKSKGKIPVLIIDELQTIGDLKVNENLIYKVFNFFIHLTKESHL
ncbi:MAG: ATP-binding protein, partial [Candidatus Altiarchaeales archaeon A3]